MPKLLRTNEVQLHMPRTGGSSLTQQLGLKKIVGSQHDGPGQIPERWRHYSTVATLRGREDWRRSMQGYLWQIGNVQTLIHFRKHTPAEINRAGIDPTFKMWEDLNGKFNQFAAGGSFKSWYDLYTAYFVDPADRIVKTEALKVHKNKRLTDGIS